MDAIIREILLGGRQKARGEARGKGWLIAVAVIGAIVPKNRGGLKRSGASCFRAEFLEIITGLMRIYRARLSFLLPLILINEHLRENGDTDEPLRVQVYGGESFKICHRILLSSDYRAYQPYFTSQRIIVSRTKSKRIVSPFNEI